MKIRVVTTVLLPAAVAVFIIVRQNGDAGANNESGDAVAAGPRVPAAATVVYTHSANGVLRACG
jgi:hypothetical protein